MADVTISQLTNRQPDSSAVFPYSEGGTTYNAALSNILPRGLISMWYGTLATIPSGWALCNGVNGTPDLRNRFIVGANVDNAGVANTNITGANTQTGGTKDAVVVSHSHGITDDGHTHDVAPVLANGTWNGANDDLGAGRGGSNRAASTTSKTTGITINSTGVAGTNQNLPPYYALAYIMKL
jgi:microcystin-dependent protein